MLSKFKNIFSIPDLRKKILFILFVLVIFRLAANIPLPSVDITQLREMFEGNQLVGMLNMFSGGGLSNISIVLLGLGPYITSSIIMQLLTMIVPRMEQMHKEEGEAGRAKFNTITRVATVPLAVVQTFAMIALLKSQGIITGITTLDTTVLIITATAGTIFLMWLGELITERKLGNGVSIMIFAGIVASVPSLISRLINTYDQSMLFTYLAFLVITIVTILGVVFISEGQRIIPISYARRRQRGAIGVGAGSSHLPIKVNQAGVIPIIFAISLVTIPTMAGQFMAGQDSVKLQEIGTIILNIFQNDWIYGGMYFSLVVLFTYFYTAVIFDPEKVAKNLQSQGGYIQGIRPGAETEEYIGKVSTRITLAGAIFLGLIAVLPIIVKGIMGGSSLLTVGGASILIVVSVVIEMVKQIDSQLVMHNYEKL